MKSSFVTFNLLFKFSSWTFWYHPTHSLGWQDFGKLHYFWTRIETRTTAKLHLYYMKIFNTLSVIQLLDQLHEGLLDEYSLMHKIQWTPQHNKFHQDMASKFNQQSVCSCQWTNFQPLIIMREILQDKQQDVGTGIYIYCI